MVSDKPKIIVIIPVYNCEAQIQRVLRRFTSEVQQYIESILIIDNRSNDRSAANAIAALQALEGIKGYLVRNSENYGLGGSQKVGFNFAVAHHFDYAVILHGDDQGDIGDLLPSLKSGAYKRFDAILGARFMRGSTLINYSWLRTLSNLAFNLLFSLILGKHLPELGAGLNLYSTNILKSQFFIKYPDNFTFNYAMTLAHTHLRHNTVFLPISWREEDQVSNVKLFSQGVKILQMLWAFIINRSRYLQSELRDTPRHEYTYETLYQTIG